MVPVNLDRVIVLVLLLLACFSGVATLRVWRGQYVWTPATILQAVVSALLTAVFLRWLGIMP